MKKRKGLGKIVVIGSLAIKGLLFSAEASCPDRTNYINEKRQNLNKMECTKKYGKESGFSVVDDTYYHKPFQY